MTRNHLDVIREKMRLWRKAHEQRVRLRAALDHAGQVERCRAADLAEDLARAGVPEGEGFEDNGVVVWYRGDDRPTLDHVYLAFHREQR